MKRAPDSAVLKQNVPKMKTAPQTQAGLLYDNRHSVVVEIHACEGHFESAVSDCRLNAQENVVTNVPRL